jgi:hypothetical protein
MNHLDDRFISNYDRLEIIADGVVSCGRGDPELRGRLNYPSRSEQTQGDAFIPLYLAGLLAMLALSATGDLAESFQVSRRAAIPRHVPSP